MSTHSNVKEWNPEPFLSPRNSDSNDTSTIGPQLKTALIIINTPIIRKDIFETVWKNSSLRYCADGGANRLYDAFGDDPNFYPDLIKGDLDSIHKSVQAFYESKGVPIVTDKDLYDTDLGKCIKSVVEVEKAQNQQYQLVIYGGLSGRLDQTIHTLHTLSKLRTTREWSWIVSEESLTCLLDVGKHKLNMPRTLLGKTCGILPLGVDSAFVKTTGLEWDLPVEGTPRTSMDGMVSTSNHLASDIITLETDKPVFWTAELGKP
ncbi:thiamine pyrophosphokinase [Cystobasidium minutum MCA 4210]|uniref:thiamine pyrophosphokinase n=1 Tax=Cystobasidium minutum MCA 4210 TaxID=1397322 RepID=UPI0034CE559A|eukprot:jgi/Rhomi1/165182/fgenesh1_kg.1_\